MTLLNEMFTVVGGGTGTMQLRLNADHAIYRAHFPGNPITPGVCIVQVIAELVGQQVGRRLGLSKIVNLKFVSTISPIEHPLIDVNLSTVDSNGAEYKVKGTITADGELKTKFSLIFA